MCRINTVVQLEIVPMHTGRNYHHGKNLRHPNYRTNVYEDDQKGRCCHAVCYLLYYCYHSDSLIKQKMEHKRVC